MSIRAKRNESTSNRTPRTLRTLAVAACAAAASLLGVGLAAEAAGAESATGQLSQDDVEVFVGLEPVRLLDTRSGLGASAPGAFGPGETRTLAVAGTRGIDPAATSIAINVTIPGSATEASFVTVWPSGVNRPETSTSNATPGQAVPNFVITAIGVDGSVEIFNERGDTHVMIDVVGFYVAMSSVEAEDSDGSSVDRAVEPDGVGATFLSGQGVPSGDLGVDGDSYLDTDSMQLYGPKAEGSWGIGTSLIPAPTVPQDSAVAATLDAATLFGKSELPIAFPENAMEIGPALTWAGDNSVIANEAGIYKVSYSIDATGGSEFAAIDLRVGGAVEGSHGVDAVGGDIDDVRLVEAAAGDTIEFVATGLENVIGLDVSGSMVIELIAAD